MKRKRDFDDSEKSEGTCLESSSNSNTSSFLDGLNIGEEVGGKIESLEMKNFMCHSNLEVKFSDRITFVTGRNGSGKSAIMVALVVVLGGSAPLTNRGKGIADFIKKGETGAKVTITLRNEGLNSFRKDMYGPRIIISRNISSSGSHGYVCKSANGLVVSKKKEEVDNIVLAFNIQINNPICILNQDVARRFLCATDKSLRFNLFTKATQLEQLETIYLETQESLTVSKKTLIEKEKGLQEASAEVSRLREKLEMFASLEERVRERTRLENEYMWALVSDEEQKLSKLLEDKNRLLTMKNEYTEIESNFEQGLKELDERVSECQRRLDEAKTEENNEKRKKREVEKEIQILNSQIERGEAQYRIMQGKIDRLLEDIKGIKEQLDQSENMASQTVAEKEKSEKKICNLQMTLEKIRDETRNVHRLKKTAEEENENLTKMMENLNRSLEELDQSKRQIETILCSAKSRSQGSGNLLKYGPYTQELVNAIEEAAKKNLFHKKPVGPCGVHVKLTGDPKWARAVESVIGDLMTTYRCDNQKDFQVLSKIMEKICGKNRPAVIIGKFLQSKHDVRFNKVSVRGLQSVLDVLSFDNDVVFNTFIDQARIETILLFETDQQAALTLTNIQNVPKNLQKGLTLQSDIYYPAPNYRTYYGNPTKPLKYFVAAAKGVDTIARYESELRETKKAFAEKSGEMERTKGQLKDSSIALERFKTQLKSLRLEEGKVQTDLNQLKDIEDTRPVMITKVALEEELVASTKKHEEISEEARTMRSSLELLREKQRETMTKLNEVETEEGKAEQSTRNWEKKLEESRNERRNLINRRKGADEKLRNINGKLQEVEDLVARGKKAVDVRIKEAKEVLVERIDTTRSPVEVHKLLEKCEKYIKSAEKIVGSRENVIAEYKTKFELYKKNKETARTLEKTIETLAKAAFKKEKRLKILQSHTAGTVSLYFQAILKTRGYDGLLTVDFEKKALDLEVKPKDANVARKDSKTLSGGERSYSTMSFILAIWKVVEMPFYFLDEFDVFMDKLNRKVIIDLLLEHAESDANKQFVFITPLDISSVQPKPNVISIYELKNPRKTSD